MSTQRKPQLNDFLHDIQAIDHSQDPDVMGGYVRDFTSVAPGQPLVVVRPRSTQEVSQVLRACTAYGLQVVVQGGRTGLAGGATVQDGEVILNLERMNQVVDFDEVGGTLCVEAGMVLEDLCQLVESKGWYFPLDLGARGSCQIGGNISTNAGGNRVLRYGPTRDLVLGVEVVLPDGTVINALRRLLKNNTGMDLKHLFIGTEGRYGVITKAMLRLFPKPQRRYSALLALNTFEQMSTLLKEARGALPLLSSFEAMWLDYLQCAAEVTQYDIPFEGAYPLYVLIELEGADSEEVTQSFERFLERSLEEGWADDAILPQSIEQSKRLWALRDASGETLRIVDPCIAFDIAISLKDMASFLDELDAVLARQYPDIVTMLFGHIGDGNLHLTTGKMNPEDMIPVEELVYQLVQKYRGSITAEHGIGVIKKLFLHYSRDEAERQLMQGLRQLLNPNNTLNQGRVLD